MRLSAATIDRLPANVARPDYDRVGQRIRVVDAVVGKRGLLAGIWRPRLQDRAILADTLAVFDRR
ncbi:MAG: hypothetical protein V4595_04665 [Pseudomonadota bacterium]